MRGLITFFVAIGLVACALFQIETNKPASASPWENLEAVTMPAPAPIQKPAAPIPAKPVKHTVYAPECENGVCRVAPAQSKARLYQRSNGRPIQRIFGGRLHGRLFSASGRNCRACG